MCALTELSRPTLKDCVSRAFAAFPRSRRDNREFFPKALTFIFADVLSGRGKRSMCVEFILEKTFVNNIKIYLFENKFESGSEKKLRRINSDACVRCKF